MVYRDFLKVNITTTHELEYTNQEYTQRIQLLDSDWESQKVGRTFPMFG